MKLVKDVNAVYFFLGKESVEFGDVDIAIIMHGNDRCGSRSRVTLPRLNATRTTPKLETR
jgi:hypothetical protein